MIPPAPFAPEDPPPPGPWPQEGAVLHVDEALIVCDKPAGLLAVPGRGEHGERCLLAWLQRRWPDADTVHRLDMATSGVMVFARGAEMQRALSRQFAQREVDKHYEAVVAGHVQAGEGNVDLPLSYDWPNRPRQQVDRAGGKPALTRWRLLAHEADTSRLALEPVTGRTHQLRVHLAALGHPIVGDALYAPEPWRRRAPRLLLHATRLSLRHPVHPQRLEFLSAAPF